MDGTQIKNTTGKPAIKTIEFLEILDRLKFSLVDITKNSAIINTASYDTSWESVRTLPIREYFLKVLHPDIIDISLFIPKATRIIIKENLDLAKGIPLDITLHKNREVAKQHEEAR